MNKPESNDAAERASGSLERMVGHQEYQPEMWTVKKDDIYAAITAVESGIEYAQMCLAEHDKSLGRTTLKNRTWAERMESDIRQMANAHETLRRPALMRLASNAALGDSAAKIEKTL